MADVDVKSTWNITAAKLRDLDIYLPNYREEGMIFCLGDDGRLKKKMHLEFEQPQNILLAIQELIGPIPTHRRMIDPESPGAFLKILWFATSLFAYLAIRRGGFTWSDIGLFAFFAIVFGSGITYLGLKRAQRYSKKIQAERDDNAAYIVDAIRNLEPDEEPPKFSLYLRPFYIKDQLFSPRPSPIRTPFLPRAWTKIHKEIETLLAMSLYPSGELVGMGIPGHYISGAGKVKSDDRDWKKLISLLSIHSLAVILIPSERPGTLWEIKMLRDSGLLPKTVFVMPPLSTGSAEKNDKKDTEAAESKRHHTAFSEIITRETPTVVHFSLEGELDATMSSTLDGLAQLYKDRINFMELTLPHNTDVGEAYGVLMAPTLLIFKDNKVVAQLIGVVPPEVVSEAIESALSKPSHDLPDLGRDDLVRAYKRQMGSWGDTFLSGLVSGVVLGLAITKLEQPFMKVLIVFSTYTFLILNNNCRFSIFQKATATILMVLIGYFWTDILEFLQSMD